MPHRLVIEVRGGCVVNVTATEPTDVLIKDYDAEGAGIEEATVDPALVQDLFDACDPPEEEIA